MPSNSTVAAACRKFGVVRRKVGEERYAILMDTAEHAEALFQADPNADNGKTNRGRDPLFDIEHMVQDACRKRVEAKLLDEEGEACGD
ncbi:hypothetical protein [Sphingomonas sp. Leaf343]|uniref:hypothetical protein n=1 Tax=Sphingomonas sp. Leaf343 TaxID=1736345 RepID=UPI0006F63621|nr:hypothetical protein [Sphingomonas sp. Leaf343]KQR81407.1 hypothetical protein ASG07_13365 [Sphingomonas sp. Leaf343]